MIATAPATPYRRPARFSGRLNAVILLAPALGLCTLFIFIPAGCRLSVSQPAGCAGPSFSRLYPAAVQCRGARAGVLAGWPDRPWQDRVLGQSLGVPVAGDYRRAGAGGPVGYHPGPDRRPDGFQAVDGDRLSMVWRRGHRADLGRIGCAGDDRNGAIALGSASFQPSRRAGCAALGHCDPVHSLGSAEHMR